MARRDQRRGAPQVTAQVITAAARRVDLTNRKQAQAQASRGAEWHAEAWGYFHEVPEVGEPIVYRGNQLAKLRLYPAVANPDDPDGDPVPVSDKSSGVPATVAAAAVAELDRLRGEWGGQAEIQKQLSINQDVAGECYLVMVGEHDRQVVRRNPDGTTDTEAETVPEAWTIRSVREVEVQDGVYRVKSSPADQHPYTLKDDGTDDIIRIWTRDPEWYEQPWSPMRHLLGECRTLQVLSQQVLAQAMRSCSAGFFTVPNELSFGPPPGTPESPEGQAPQDPLDKAFNDVLVRPIDNPSDPSSVQPGIIRGAADYLKPEVLRRISFYDPQMDQVLEDKIKARVERIARGINLPVEKVMGHQQTTFANAAQVDQDEFDDYLQPSAQQGCDALTYAFLTPQLEANDAVPDEWVDRIFVWYNPSDLIAKPNREANADSAHDRFVISDDAYRDAKGFGPDDAPDDLEILIRAGLRRGIFTAEISKALLELLGVDIAVEALPGAAPADGGAADGATAQMLQLALLANARRQASGQRPQVELPIDVPSTVTAARSSTSAGVDYGRQLTQLDVQLRTRLVAASSTAMDRALERAANVLRSHTAGRSDLRASLRNVAPGRYFAHLGPSLVAEVLSDTDPLAGAWDGLRDQFMEWGAHAQAQALDVAGQVAAGFTASRRAELQLRQAGDLGEAWSWMERALTGLANDRMFDPDPAQVLGEFDPTLRVPTGLVRQALARAGGATGLQTGEGGAWLALTDAGTRPAGGIGTGELLRGAMRDEGVQVEAYRWVYGPAYRLHPFEPHQQLDGLLFTNFDDAALANPDSFPEFAYYLPGDHAGCVCDFEPVIVPAAEVAA